MTPIFMGRIQTRIFLIAVIGSLWTLVVVPFLPGGGSLGDRYQATFTVLALVIVLGFGWELIYHLLQQFRWEKDWPIMFGLLQGVPEGIAAWIVVQTGSLPGDPAIAGGAFFVHFATTWLITWLFAIGPIRVPFIRYRFKGGRFV